MDANQARARVEALFEAVSGRDEFDAAAPDGFTYEGAEVSEEPDLQALGRYDPDTGQPPPSAATWRTTARIKFPATYEYIDGALRLPGRRDEPERFGELVARVVRAERGVGRITLKKWVIQPEPEKLPDPQDPANAGRPAYWIISATFDID